MTRHGLEAPDVLTAGEWRNEGGVQVWVECEPTAPSLANQRHLALLIACPSCHAKVAQTCRTTGGNPTAPHTVRLVGRHCPCGALVQWKKQLCAECVIEARRETYRRREVRQPTRVRRRASGGVSPVVERDSRKSTVDSGAESGPAGLESPGPGRLVRSRR